MTTRKNQSATKFAPKFSDGPLSPNASAQSLLMTPEEVLAITGYKRVATLYANIPFGFPAPVSLGPRRSNGRAGKAMWVRAEVMAWLEAKIAEPRPLALKHRAETLPA